MPNLIATTELRYAGKNLHAGDSFDASDKDAKILKAIKKARDYTDNSPNASDLPAEVMSRASKREPATEVEEPAPKHDYQHLEDYELEQHVAVKKAMKEAVEEDEAPKPQTYHRRDMVAEAPKAQPPKKRGRPGRPKKSQ